MEVSQTVLIWLISSKSHWNGSERASQEYLGLVLAVIMVRGTSLPACVWFEHACVLTARPYTAAGRVAAEERGSGGPVHEGSVGQLGGPAAARAAGESQTRVTALTPLPLRPPAEPV